jgi:uncharacterized protein (DUF885 family)
MSSRWTRSLLLLSAGVFLLAPRPASCAVPADDATSARLVRETGDAYLKLLAEDSLYLRQRLGLPIDRLPEVSVGREEARARSAAALAARLETIERDALSLEDALSLDVLRLKLGQEADAPRLFWLQFPVTPYASPLGEVHHAFRTFPFRDVADLDRYLALLGRYPGLIGQMQAKLAAQAEKGIRIPKPELELVKAFLGSAIGEDGKSLFSVDASRLAGLPPAEAAAFRARVESRVAGDVTPALRALISSVSGDYAAKAPETVGLGQYPGGREAYERLARLHTTLPVMPGEVHEIGLAEVARIESRMADVRRTLGFSGSAAEFRQSLKTNPRFFPKTPEEIGQRLMAFVARIEPKVDRFFLRRPKAPYGVKRLDPEREPALTFGIYEPPTPGEATGLYRFNGSKLEDRSLLNAGALIFHELVPGHHFQIALANENEAIPAFRRELYDTAYTEGWGDYAAGLGEEMGMYDDPYDLYGRLGMDMFVSVRLVVDTGMNALGWSREKAVAYMREHLMETDTQIATESLRYSTDIPAQALAYKMGSRGIRELRGKVERELGSRFDVRRFHEAVLGSGSLPLSVLERRLDDFVAREKRTGGTRSGRAAWSR